MSSDAQQTAAAEYSTDTEYVRIEQSRLMELQGSTQELVSAVDEVTTVTDEVLDADSVGDSDLLRGLIKNDDGFTVWLDPQALAT